MPILPCPMGARCTDGEDGATWKSVDIAFEQAQVLVADHVKFAHQNVAAGAAPAQLKAEKLESCLGEEITLILFGRLGPDARSSLTRENTRA